MKRLPLRELGDRRHHVTPDESVQVVGRGRLGDTDCSGIVCQRLAFVAAGNAATRSRCRRRPAQLIERCDFSGLTTPDLFIDGGYFRDCTFGGIDVRIGIGTNRADLVGCTFSGRLAGLLSAGWGRSSYRIEGNDFSGLTGVGFLNGVEWRKNRFDIGGKHLILTASDACNAALEGPLAAMCGSAASSVRGRGPLALQQDWILLHREDYSPRDWNWLRERLTSRPN